MNVNKAISLRLKEICQQKGIKLEDIFSQLEVSQDLMKRYLNGEQFFGIIFLKKLCDLCEITLSDFFTCKLFDKRKK